MLVKIIIVVFLAIILYSLGSALFYLVREGDKGDTKSADRVVKALTWRIGLSLLLFILLFIAGALGWIEPHAISAGAA